MNVPRSSTAALLCVVAMASSACVRTSEGVPVAETAATVESGTSTAPRSTTAPSTDARQPEPGVVATTRSPTPAGAVTCSPSTKPPVAALAQIADPAAPRVTIALPSGWGVSVGTGDVGIALTGPGGASGNVTIAATRLDPDAAFRGYTDDVMDQAPVSSVSILPAELCSYSGQKLMGTLSGEPGDGVEFTDHVVHVWTNAGDYLVAVHVQTPTDVEVDAGAVAQITDDFEIRLP